VGPARAGGRHDKREQAERDRVYMGREASGGEERDDEEEGEARSRRERGEARAP